MKKFLCVLLLALVLFGVFSNYGSIPDGSSGPDVQKSISKKIIRFHVLANSDSDTDQNLKLNVKDNVLAYIYPRLKNSKSIEESRDILKKNDSSIRNVALNTIKKAGFNYKVKTMLSDENFPIKSYGAIVLPEGNYEAYRIIIGDGNGHNWWCVMFPPLCFIDITKGDVSYKKTEDEMKKVLNKKEFEEVDNKKGILTPVEVNGQNINIKFKIVELLKKLIK